MLLFHTYESWKLRLTGPPYTTSGWPCPACFHLQYVCSWLMSVILTFKIIPVCVHVCACVFWTGCVNTGWHLCENWVIHIVIWFSIISIIENCFHLDEMICHHCYKNKFNALFLLLSLTSFIFALYCGYVTAATCLVILFLNNWRLLIFFSIKWVQTN